MQKGKGVGSGRRGNSQSKRGGVFVSKTSPPSRGGGWDGRRNAGGIGDDNRKVRVPSVVSAPVIIVNRDVRGPIIVKIKICPADRNASTGVEKKGGIRERCSSRKSGNRNRDNEGRGSSSEISETGGNRVRGEDRARGTNVVRGVLLGGDEFDNLSDDMVKRADVNIRGRHMNVVSPRDRALGNLTKVNGGGNVDPRVRSESSPLSPDLTSFVLPERGRAGRKAPSGRNAMKAAALAGGTSLDVSGPERGTNGPPDLIRKSAEGPPLISERSSWGDTRPA